MNNYTGATYSFLHSFLSQKGSTALILAASGGHRDVVKYLVESGANVNHGDQVSLTMYIDTVELKSKVHIVTKLQATATDW